ncbi:MAG: diguanylate cyclase [Candidatus Korobacteraceae bacterium]
MKILVADDSSLYRMTLKPLLEAWGYEVVLSANGYEAKHILDSDDAPRLAILNCFMPGLGGLDLCELIRARTQGYVYTILLTAADHKSDVLAGFEAGADDYLCKPFGKLELKARLKVGERIVRSQEELGEAREALKFEASHDSFLRLWNHRAILDLLSTELSRAKRMQTPLSIFFVDLDFFKLVNDTYGHLVGDEVLRNVAERMSSTVREYDHVGRYGGEEFLVVLPDCRVETAREVAERVRQRIGEGPILTVPTQVEVTVSIGVSQWRAGQEIHDLLHEADVAMYRAKQRGRNRVVVDSATTETVKRVNGAASRALEKRRHIRHSGLDRPLQVNTFHQGNATRVQGQARDIGEEGMGARIPCSLAINEKVTLAFSLEARNEYTVSAIVRHCYGFNHGFEFISIEPALREAIARLPS